MYNKTYLYLTLYLAQSTHNISVSHAHTVGATNVIPWEQKVSLDETINQESTCSQKALRGHWKQKQLVRVLMDSLRSQQTAQTYLGND
jgi:hypothetical protein